MTGRDAKQLRDLIRRAESSAFALMYQLLGDVEVQALGDPDRMAPVEVLERANDGLVERLRESLNVLYDARQIEARQLGRTWGA